MIKKKLIGLSAWITTYEKRNRSRKNVIWSVVSDALKLMVISGTAAPKGPVTYALSEEAGSQASRFEL